MYVEIVERPVADQLLDLDVDEIRRLLAIGAHHFRGWGNTRCFIAPQGCARLRASFSRSANVRASIAACATPFEPLGYIGCAASPASVTQPKVQRSMGSLSTIGYSRICSASRISLVTSSQSKCQIS